MAFLPPLRSGLAPRLALLLALLLGSSFSGYAQRVYLNKRYRSSPTDSVAQTFATGVLPTATGYAVCGQINQVGPAGGTTLLLRFLDLQGTVVRTRSFRRTAASYGIPAGGGGGWVAHPRGGYAMMATVDPRPAAPPAPMLWRFNSLGDTLWTRTYPASLLRAAYTGCLTRDGGYALLGTATRTTGPGTTVLLIRTDSLGNKLWEQTYDAAYTNEGFFIVQTRDGGFLLSGYAWRGGPVGMSYSAPYVIKTDSLGHQQWARVFGTLVNRRDGVGVARPTADGGYVVAASRWVRDFGLSVQWQPVIYKLDSAGNTVWERKIGPARGASEMYALHELADGSLVAAGQQCDQVPDTLTGALGSPEGFAFKLCPEGDSLWFRTYKLLRDPQSSNYLRAWNPTPDGGFIGCGFLFAHGADPPPNDSWVFKVDSAGHLVTYGPPVTVTCALPPPPLGTGNDAGTGTASGLPPPAVAVFPNPATHEVFLTYHLPPTSPPAYMELYDPLGRRCRRLALAGHTGQASLPLAGLAPGLYAYRVLAGNALVGGGTLVKLP